MIVLTLNIIFSKSKSSYKQIQKERKIKKGFNSAFIVTFKGDKQIKLSEGIRQMKRIIVYKVDL